MQKYETPWMETVDLEQYDVITLSQGFGDGPLVDDGSWNN